MILNRNDIEGDPNVEENASRLGLLTEAKYVEKHMPLLEGFDDAGFITNRHAPPMGDYLAACTAVLMDNVRRQLVPESTDIGHALAIQKRAAEMGIGEATSPTQTGAFSGATTLPMVLGLIRKLMPRLIGIRFLAQIQPLTVPSARVFFLRRDRHDDGTDTGAVEQRAGWSYRSWIDDPGENTAIVKSLKLTLTSQNLVDPISRKFKVETTIEAEQDIRAFFGLDAVAIISDAGADELAAEIDEEVLHKMWATGTGPTVQYGSVPTSPVDFSNDPSGWADRLMEAIYRTDELIYSKKRVRVNRMVVGSEFAIFLKRLRQFRSEDTNSFFGDQRVGVVRVGTLDSQYEVLQMPLPWPTDTAMLSFQGSSPLEGTYIWLPYIPLMQYSMDMDPSTMRRTISWLRRDTDFTVDKGYIGLTKVDETNITGLSYPSFTEFDGVHETSVGDVT